MRKLTFLLILLLIIITTSCKGEQQTAPYVPINILTEDQLYDKIHYFLSFAQETIVTHRRTAASTIAAIYQNELILRELRK